MAETAPQPNNIRVRFRGRPEVERPRVPTTSKSQARAMFAAAAGKSTLGIPKKVGQEFTADMGPGSVKRLPERRPKPRGGSDRAKQLMAAGRISPRAAKRAGL